MQMSRKFRQLTHEDRVAIATLLRAGHGKAAIAKQLGCHRSTVYREIARNGSSLGYLPLTAELRIKERRKRSFKLNRDKMLRQYIFDKLKLSWSPEQIAGRLKLENQGKSLICHETIYAYLYSDYGIRNKYYQFLRQKRRFRYPKISRTSRIKIPNRVSIHERSQEANDRTEIGHWEGDLMHFGRKTQTNLITLRERYSRYMIAVRNPNRKADTTAADNGFEFAKHERIANKLQAKTYFCEPYKSYQKGTIENGNKQLREWLPKDSMINIISQHEINSWLEVLNRRPMKCLNFYTPKEIFYTKVSRH